MAASNSLGTLTLDIIANLGGFDEPLSRSERETKRAMKAMGMAVDEFGNYTDRTMKKTAESMKQLDALYAKSAASMRRELDLFGDVSRAAEMRYDLELGALKELSDMEKTALTEMTRRISAMESANAAFREQQQQVERLNSTHRSLSENLDRELALFGTTTRAAALRYDTELGALRGLTNEQKDYLMMLTTTVDAMEAAARATAEEESNLKALESQYEGLAAAQQREIALFEETTRAAAMRYDLENSELSKLSDARKQGLIDQANQLDMLAEQARQKEQDEANTEKLTQSHDRLQEALLQELATYGDVTRVAKLRYDMEKGELRGLTDAQKQSTLQMAQQLDDLDAAAGRAAGGFRGLRGQAQNIGWQMQDIAVQMQMGTDAMVILSQQGSQLASGFGPKGALVGALIAVGGAVAGVLMKSLMDTKDAMEDMADRARELAKDLRDLSDAEREIVDKARGYSIKDKQKEYDDLTETISKQREQLEEMRKLDFMGANRRVDAGPYGWVNMAVDSTEKLAEKLKELEANELKLVAVRKELEELNDPSGAQDMIRDLHDEIALLRLKGEELHRVKGAQLGYADGALAAYVSLNLLKDAIEEEIEAEKKAEKERNKKKTGKDEETKRLENIEKIISGLQKEAAMFDITTKAAEMEYDILNDIVKVVGGIEGAEAQRLIAAAAVVDAREREKEVAEQLLEIQERLNPGDAAFAKYEKEVKVLQDALGKGLDLQQFDKLMKQLDDEFADSLLIDVDAIGKGTQEVENIYTAMWERIGASGADVFLGLMNGTDDMFDGILDSFKQLLAEMANQALLQPIMMNIQQKFTGESGGGKDGASGAASAVGAGGIWAAVAVAVVAGIGIHNKEQEEKFAQMTAEYRQGVQFTGTLLGDANAKSNSIANGIADLKGIGTDALGVNRHMLTAMEGIREGLTGVASGFAKSIAYNPGMNIQTGTSAFVDSGKVSGESAVRNWMDSVGMRDPITKFVGNFLGSLGDKVTQEIFKKQVKVTDSGISIIGESLANIMEDGVIQAFNYADVNTKKKVFGVTTSNKMKTTEEAMGDFFNQQLSSVFQNAGKAMGEAGKAFGLDIQDFANRLVVDTQKISLKDLSAEEITAELEHFMSSTMDKWAEIMLGGTDALFKYQEAGEGAFETMIRLASQTNYLVDAFKMADLKFNATGMKAVEMSQAIAQMAGGFDNLRTSLDVYYENFFTDSEKLTNLSGRLTSATAGIIDQLPRTTREFRDVIEALDLTSEADQRVFATLMNLTPAIYEYITALETQQGSLEEFMKQYRDRVETAFMDEYALSVRNLNLALEEAIAAARELGATEADLAIIRKASALDMLDIQKTQTDAALDAMRKSIDAAIAQQAEVYAAEVAAINADFDARAAAMDSAMKIQTEAISRTLEALKASVDQLRGLSDALGSAMDTLIVKSPQLESQRWFMAADRVSTLSSNFRATGALPSAEEMERLTGNLGNAENNFSTFEEYSRASGRLINQLFAMKDATDTQLSIEEKMLANAEASLENAQANHSAMMSSIQAEREARLQQLEAEHNAQIRALEEQYELAQEQINAIRDVNTAVLSVEEAINLMKESIAAELGALKAADQIKYEQMVTALEAIAVTNDDMRSFARTEFEERELAI